MNESIVQIRGWQHLLWLRHGFGTRRGGVSSVYRANDRMEAGDGDLNAGWTSSDDPANVTENRRRLVAAADATSGPLVTVRQVHSAMSLPVPEAPFNFFNQEGRAALEADGLMTNVSGPVLGIQTADCVPVLVVDRRRRAVAAFHAGWRGTAAAIVEKGIAHMANEFGSAPADLLAAIGPSIGACCYSIGNEVRQKFEETFDYAGDLFIVQEEAESPTLYVDLWEANRRQLLSAGVPPVNITVVGECSGCTGLPGRRKYFSHRCENGFTGRMLSVIAMVRE